jgi:uncharacterized protein
MVLALPAQVDARRLATQGARLVGEFPVQVLARLNALFSEVCPVAVDLNFALNGQGQVTVSGVLQARFTTTCQRCLQPVTLSLRGNLEHVPEAEAAENGFARSPQAPELPLDLLTLIEDEVLLACPMAPTHPAGDCRPLTTQDELPATPDRKNPFDVLSALRQNTQE